MSVLLAAVMLGAMLAAAAIDLVSPSRRSWPVLVADGLMALAMLDSCVLGDVLLPAWAWALTLVCCLVATAAARRREDRHASRLHAVGLLLSAGMVAIAGGMHGGAAAGGMATGHGHGAAELPSPMLGLLALAVVYGIVAVSRPVPAMERVRNASAGVGLAAMAGMLAFA